LENIYSNIVTHTSETNQLKNTIVQVNLTLLDFYINISKI